MWGRRTAAGAVRALQQPEGNAMKRMLVAAAVVALVGIVGCNNGTPGGPGADKARKQEKESNAKKLRDKVSQPEDTFSLSVPTLGVKLKQGESKNVTIGITRGKNFDQDVTLKFEGLPKGVSADPASPAIKHGDKEAKVMFKAADDAALGDFNVTVIGHPTTGPDATSEFKLTVAKK
jgi:hypothetical protein